MILRSITYTNFRNLHRAYSLSKRINLIVAPNGKGKTNLLEGIGFLSTGKSFRTNNERVTINDKLLSDINSLAFFRLEGKVIDSLGEEIMREVILERIVNGEAERVRKTLKLDGNRASKSSFSTQFYSVIFSPNTVDLVLGSPSIRRNDLDDFLSSINEEYENRLQTYKKIVRNRNKLFEKYATYASSKKELSFWNTQLVKLGAEIIYARMKFLQDINPVISESGKMLFTLKSPKVTLEYITKFSSDGSLSGIQKSLEKKIHQNISKEMAAGITLYGPHRDDFRFMINGKDGKEFASRGQQRLCALIYKISQWYVIKKETNRPPVLLLDDIFSELDREVASNVQFFISKLESQVILTALGEEPLNKTFLKNSQKVMIE